MPLNNPSVQLDADAAAAMILCELARSIPPPRPAEAAAPVAAAVLAWPSVMKGKRSRRDAAVKERLLRFSPTSPLDLSGGSAASTSGSSSKVGYSGRQLLVTRSTVPPRSNGSQRSKKKMRRLPEVKEEVRSLVEENNFLKREAEELRIACMVLKKENCNLEARIDMPVEMTRAVGSSSNIDQNPDLKAEGFDLPDLNLPDLNLPPPVDFC
ncbi:hypothetical protein LUZ60_017178 [Juncus effusus]|nr:hypothetical protein LUZ60_017178 [Juncus effusus]